MIGRNDSCHCGSGKKYKKCCLKKDQAGTLEALKEQNELNRLGDSISNVTKFLAQNVSNDYIQNITTEYCSIFDSDTSNPILEGIVSSYLTLVHCYENGMRGIEWYMKATNSNDELLAKIAALPLRTVKIIENTATTSTLEDAATKETFTVERETLTMPWGIMQAIILPRQNGNAVVLYKHFPAPPNYREKQPTLPENHLDLLKAVFLHHDMILEGTEAFEMSGSIKNATDFLKKAQNEEALFIENDQTVHVLEKVYDYEDNAFENTVKVGKKLATISISGTTTTVICYGKENIDKMLAWSKNYEELLIDAASVKAIDMNSSEEIENLVIMSLGKINPVHATAIKTRVLYDVHAPLQSFNGKSLAVLGNTDEVESYIQELEYYSYTDFLQYGISTDFVSLRKELGLQPSTFVSKGKKGEERHSTMTVSSLFAQDVTVSTTTEDTVADLAVVEKFLTEVELPNALANHTQIEAIATFYFDKTEGKAKSTQQKYRKALYEICEPLATSNESLEAIIQLKASSDQISATQQKNIESVGKTLLKFIR